MKKPIKRSDLVIRRAAVKVLECGNNILAEARGKNVLFRAKLVSRLSDDRVDDVQTGDFVFWFALLVQI